MRHRSHGTGRFDPRDLARCGPDCVFEEGALVFHPETVELGRNVYVGHHAILKGYYENRMVIGDETFVGQQCFLHSAGGLFIGPRVGIGPGTRIITSAHEEAGREVAVVDSPLRFAAVHVGEGADLGISSVVLPGVTIGEGALVGAGAVVTKDIPPFTVAAGAPAEVLRERPRK